ncbi:MAG: RNA polymerase sigma factor [Clostridiales bacterium]|nr:RNA polymerase sigma factor [Clostridiales bacterium]
MDVIKNPEDAVDRYGTLVYRLALAQTKKPADAEDVFQEVFLRLVRNKRPFESNEHLKAWLIRVTVNCSRSLWRTILRRGDTALPGKEALEARTYGRRIP